MMMRASNSIMRFFFRILTTIILIAIILALALVLTGCSSSTGTSWGSSLFGGSDDNMNAPGVTRENICTDNGGLSMTFLDNMPPDQIFERDPFYIGLRIQNQGCFDINKGYVSVGGYEEDITELRDKWGGLTPRQEILNNLRGKTIYSPEGDWEDIIFKARNKQIRYNLDEMSETFSAYACYQYHTIAYAQICINPNRPDTLGIRNDVCESGKVLLDQKQGAPVIIKSVKSSTIRTDVDTMEVNFDILVENIGGGNVRNFEAGTCTGNSTITLGEVSFSGYSSLSKDKDFINCTPLRLNLRDERSANKRPNLFRCRIEIYDNAEAYTTLLKMRLDYAYTITADKGMLIKSLD